MLPYFFINIKLYKTLQLEHLSSHLQHKKTTQKEYLLFPTIVFYHMNHFNNELPFFVFLAIFKGMFLCSHKKMYDIRFTVNKKYQRRQSERAECNLISGSLWENWHQKIVPIEREDNILSFQPKLTYFQPNVVLQHSQ